MSKRDQEFSEIVTLKCEKVKSWYGIRKNEIQTQFHRYWQRIIKKQVFYGLLYLFTLSITWSCHCVFPPCVAILSRRASFLSSMLIILAINSLRFWTSSLMRSNFNSSIGFPLPLGLFLLLTDISAGLWTNKQRNDVIITHIKCTNYRTSQSGK